MKYNYEDISNVEFYDENCDEIIYIELTNGKSIDISGLRGKIDIEKTFEPCDWLYNWYNIPIVNQNVLNSLNDENIDFKIIPVNIIRKEKVLDYQYWMLYVPIIYELVDWDKSQWNYAIEGNEFSSMLLEEVVYKEIEIKENIFWTKKPHLLVLKEKLANVFRNKSFTGIEIVPLTEYLISGLK